MDITCVSDLHGHYPSLEGGDLLIVAGDLTATDSPEEHCNGFCRWLVKQSYRKMVVIAGNHDNLLKEDECISIGYDPGLDIEYLCDSGTEFEGLKIWGSPWTTTFKGMNPHCKAFTVDTEEELGEKWKLIPDDVGILVTHSPPFGVQDRIDKSVNPGSIASIGSRSLLRKVQTLKNLKLHCFGHVHEDYGTCKSSIHLYKEKYRNPLFVNASHVNEHYKPVNKPIRVIL